METGSCAGAAVDLWPALKGVQGGEQVLCAPEKHGTGLWLVRYFQEPISWSQSLHLFRSGKALNPFKVTPAPHCLQKTFRKISAWMPWTPPSPKSYILTSPYTASSEQSLSAIWGSVSWAAVLILTQRKVNAKLSPCATFFLVDRPQWRSDQKGDLDRPLPQEDTDTFYVII